MSGTVAAPSFGDRLAAVFAQSGQLCAGIDPHTHLLNEWKLPDSAAGARDFGLRVVEASAGVIGMVKPQIAFYERFGVEGFRALERVLSAAREADLLVVADVKRGDIGSTMDAYAAAWLTPGSDFEADAMTVTAYVGTGALGGTIDAARSNGKGLFVLCATSNPEAVQLQTARVHPTGGLGDDHRSKTVSAAIAEEMIRQNRQWVSESRMGSFGLVLGATQDFDAFGLDVTALAAAPAVPVLAPGFGQQGATYADLPDRFGPVASSVIVSVSRSVLSGPAHELPRRIVREAQALAEVTG